MKTHQPMSKRWMRHGARLGVAIGAGVMALSVASVADAQIRDDVIFDIEPGGLGLLTIDGDSFEVGISGGRVGITTDDVNCLPLPNQPCAATISFFEVGFNDFTFDGTRVELPLVGVTEPLATFDEGGGILVPPGTLGFVAATVDGDRGVQFRSSPEGFNILFNPATQQAVVTGSFAGNIEGVELEAFFIVNAMSPFVNLPPVADAGPDLIASGCGEVLPLQLQGSASDPQGGSVVAARWLRNGVVVGDGLNPTVPLGVGVHELTLEVHDSFGGRDTDTSVLEVVTAPDQEPPTFTAVPADITTTSCGTLNLGTATATDECGEVTVTNNAPAKFPPGTTIVTWTATDEDGNTSTATQRVTLTLTDDPACCPAGTNVIVGTSNNDTLNGTAGADCILGRGGQDVINGLGGNDFVSGGEGNDTLSGGLGNDQLFGGSGQDQLSGSSGDDALSGGDGDDVVTAGIGNDTLRGGQGQDRLFGEDGNDRLFGDDGDDRLEGGAGNDDLVGGGLHDTCLGGTGTNTFVSCETPGTNSCDDDAENGTETDVDCGGACSSKCGNGQGCTTGADCQGAICSGGVCQAGSTPPSGGLQATLSISTDWGGGYCATLEVKNNALVPTTNWNVGINIVAATTYTTWNGNFSATTGASNVTPAFSWNQVIAAGATDSSVGFCANRAVPGSGALPTIVTATGQF